MTGSGSPCGACKFLRRKCVRGCVFAPYFCHEQGAVHFAAIHKVFGASNVSKLLAHLPVTDRSEAAMTISYEAQARLQDPVYGCVAHIFALQQQVVNLQAQLASLKAQTAQGCSNGSNSSSPPQNDYSFTSKFPPFGHYSSSTINHQDMTFYENGLTRSSSSSMDQSCQSYGDTDSFDMGDLQSVAFAYLNSHSNKFMKQ
ncbi:LOB domain-containing protein 29 [Carex littledalei]|uniref:LOB domain-containing protein 29 n=1 Tax=Carex littledalei TaxID=544730 RepID=A0A833VWI1_9POAL|nr:LOB domain-containing protein 29 [Carex littledalei]